jgi:hypothetical protein
MTYGALKAQQLELGSKRGKLTRPERLAMFITPIRPLLRDRKRPSQCPAAGERTYGNPGLLCRGTRRSNPSPASESRANLLTNRNRGRGRMTDFSRDIEILLEEKLTERSAENGRYLLDGLRGLMRHPVVGDVRGKGLASTNLSSVIASSRVLQVEVLQLHLSPTDR